MESLAAAQSTVLTNDTLAVVTVLAALAASIVVALLGVPSRVTPIVAVSLAQTVLE